MNITNRQQLETIVGEINDQNDPDGIKSQAVIKFWDALPDTLVLAASNTLEDVTDWLQIPYPETFDFNTHNPAFKKLCGFDKFSEPQSFPYAGNGDVYWLIEIKTQGLTLQTFLTNWIKNTHEQYEHNKAFQG